MVSIEHPKARSVRASGGLSPPPDQGLRRLHIAPLAPFH